MVGLILFCVGFVVGTMFHIIVRHTATKTLVRRMQEHEKREQDFYAALQGLQARVLKASNEDPLGANNPRLQKVRKS